ncbi:MAG: 50S ribosomal protein L25/general stress protein Ctc [Deltaproteobacteria bacterium]|nr:50S ribosomal protein L25/general stress protein Ctc [Deltaproteobacteria bacterium]MBW2025811.1 50S ribosomal protein L25/general stress protein Ctc [Deltaproteobacteria bacterium]MBW2125948.1 50S ribosomal protein L25/general stress protein Ctc [Deltaproteobacteria bacterium]
MVQTALAAQLRTSRGKEAARKLRRNKQVPGIIYGPYSQPVMVAVDYSQLNKIVRKATSENIMLDMNIQTDKGTETKKVMLKELQVDPIKDTYLHADFYEISMDTELTVEIPVHLVNTPVGVTKGGVLQHVKREIAISCLPDKLVDFVEVDVSDLDIGDAVHVADIPLPEGVECLDEGDITVAVVAAPTVGPEREAEEELEEETAEETEKAEQSSEE